MSSTMRVYADTSLFGGVFDAEFDLPSKQFFSEAIAGRFTLVTSALVAAEVEPAPSEVRELFERYLRIAEVCKISEDALTLQQLYIDAGIVPFKSQNDALHVAIATVAACDIIVSWNFRHIVHFDKIDKYNAVNVLNEYRRIGIFSPLEVIRDDDD